MRFYAIWDDGIIQTDDYDKDEIKHNRHIINIVKQLVVNDVMAVVRVYDENNRFIKTVTQNSIQPIELFF